MDILQLLTAGGQNKNRSTSPSKRTKDFRGVDRRKNGRGEFTCGLTFKTALAVGPIEDWLKDRFAGEYQLNLQDMSDDLRIKQIRIAFAMPFQRDAFKEFLQSQRA